MVVTRSSHHTFHIAVGVKAVLAQDDAGEAAGRGVRGVDSQASAAKVCHRCHIRAAEKPEERAVGVDAQGFPTDVVRQPRQQGPAQSDRRSSTQALFAPANPVADGGVDPFILVVALLVSDVGDQFLVDTPPLGEVDGMHVARSPFLNLLRRNPLQSIARPPLTGR